MKIPTPAANDQTMDLANAPTRADLGAETRDDFATGVFAPTQTSAPVLPTAPGPVKIPIPAANDQTIDLANAPTQADAPMDGTVAFDAARTEAMTNATPGPSVEETLAHVGGETQDLVDTLDATRDATAVPASRRAPSTKRSIPANLGRYRLKRFHARGGMGEIWVAEDTVIGRNVALKRMLTDRADQVYRFRVEAQVTGQLEHPGIAPVYELTTDDKNQPYYVMKFVRGETLKKVIETFHAAKLDPGARDLERSRLLHMMISLCQTVAYAHSRGVLHRDLKPDNVMLGPFGETILLDWGIARVMGGDDSNAHSDEMEPRFARVDAPEEGTETMEGAITGTPAYMAPEVAAGLTREVDYRSDVFLLGAILYEMITGRQPRSAKTLQELLRKAKTERPDPARTIDPTIPRALEAICIKATALDKTERYQSALEMADDLQRFVAGEPVAAYPESPWEQAWRWARRHRVALTRAAAAILVLGLGTFAVVKVRQAERVAAVLKAQDQARRDLQTFRQLADEASFYAATTDTVTENAPYFDPRKGETTARAALALTQNWGQSLDKLPLAEEREPTRRELYELYLLTAHILLSQETPESAREAIVLLDKARPLHAQTLGETRLRDRASARLPGQPARVALGEPIATETAHDHFLRGEEYRVESSRKKTEGSDRPDWQRDPELLEKAAVEYRAALALDPAEYWARFQLGRSYLSMGKLAEAVEVLGACTALKPNSPWAFGTRGLTLAQMKRFDEAKADFDHALQVDPNALPARLNRGFVHRVLKENDLARADFDAVLSAPKSQRLIEAAYYRGLINSELGMEKSALDDFTLVITENPRFQATYKQRARIYFQRGERDAGRKDLDTLSLMQGRDPNGPEWQLHGYRGHFLRQIHGELPPDKRRGPQGQELAKLTVDQLIQAIRQGGRAWDLFDDLGAMFELQGRAADALTAYAQGLKIEPENVKLRIKRGWLLVALNKNEAAAADFAVAIKAEPKNAEAHTGLGYAQAMGNHPSDAQREAELALLNASDDFRVLHNIACIYAALSRDAGPQASANQEVTLALLRKALTAWKRTETLLNEPDLIRAEPAFKPLQNLPEFQKLTAP